MGPIAIARARTRRLGGHAFDIGVKAVQVLAGGGAVEFIVQLGHVASFEVAVLRERLGEIVQGAPLARAFERRQAEAAARQVRQAPRKVGLDLGVNTAELADRGDQVVARRVELARALDPFLGRERGLPAGDLGAQDRRAARELGAYLRVGGALRQAGVFVEPGARRRLRRRVRRGLGEFRRGAWRGLLCGFRSNAFPFRLDLGGG